LANKIELCKDELLKEPRIHIVFNGFKNGNRSAKTGVSNIFMSKNKYYTPPFSVKVLLLCCLLALGYFTKNEYFSDGRKKIVANRNNKAKNEVAHPATINLITNH
jgi:hypothetical protein